MRYVTLTHKHSFKDKDLTTAYNALIDKNTDLYAKLAALDIMAHHYSSDEKHKIFLDYIYKTTAETLLKREIEKIWTGKYFHKIQA